jgi:vacuolar protein sorting-associated protein 13A/C
VLEGLSRCSFIARLSKISDLGHLGRFTLSLYWMNLGNKPVEILIEDVYLLVVPSPRDNNDPKEGEERSQAAKAERLANAEALQLRGETDLSTEGLQQQGLFDSLMAKVLNNLQITVKNIYIRYEDGLSVPGVCSFHRALLNSRSLFPALKRPFALGITLAELSAVSVDGNWQPAFIESTAGAIRKVRFQKFASSLPDEFQLAKLQSLAIYFDTDSSPVSGLSREDVIKNSLASVR